MIDKAKKWDQPKFCFSHFPPFLSNHPDPSSPGGTEPAWTILNPTRLTGFQQANLIFLNTGLCFSFITAGDGGEL